MPRQSALKTETIAAFLAKKNLQYDLLTQKTRQLMGDGQWHELKERDENDLYIECCAESEMNITDRLFQKVLNSSTVPEVNPLKDYVQSRAPWNPGMPDYIGQAARMVHMATDAEQQLWQRCFLKWFVAMVAGWVDSNIVNHQVIVLIGRQGIYKSTWIRSLLPPQLANYVSDMLEVEHLDKDEQLRSVEYGLINLDEIDKLSERELNKLKAQVTTTHVDVRAAFGRNKKKRVRVASYAASGNKKEFLTDQTGNRRWLPFNVTAIDSPYKNKLPYEGMYAQALYLMKNGFNFWFDLDDIKALEGHIEEFMVTQNEEELIPIYFSPAQADDAGVVFLTLSEIAAKIVAYGNLKKTPDNRRLGAIMTKLGFIKERVGHDNRCGYYVREHTQAEIDRIRHPESF
jgi:predicted P-loop ATPase